ncbi:hypothetical protein [Leeuwenhoekiella sp. NPDC079379]|uniref:hypothetical protein n=1 Tax=Leeuwenhoekiella sp. NPDC079379 TaxID=3364122 RepID=UPI0037CBED6A
MKNSLILLILLTFSHALIAQVGIGTVDPEARLDIVSTNSGILIPRVALTSITDEITVFNPAGGTIAESTLVYNDSTGGLTPAGYYYWQNSQWNQIASTSQKRVHFGKILVSASGVINVAGVGFSPKSVEFVAINRIQGYNGTYRADGNNTNDIRMAGGMTVGYAQNNGTSIDQQVISNGFSGSSINNIGTFASSSHCIAAFFVNNNGEPIHDNGSPTGGTDTQDGLVRASLQSFNSDGFTLNFDRFLVGDSTNNRTNQIAIIYKAYR